MRLLPKLCLAIVVLASALSGGFSSEVAAGNEALVWQAATRSGQVEAKAVILEKRRSGSLMDFRIRVSFDRLPQGKSYQFYILDAGMKRDGLKPAPVPDAAYRWTPDANGHLEFGFVLDGFSRGEWIQCTLRSTDRSVQKTIRFIPFK